MPATTPRGYPYPLPTEPVAEGAQAIRNLAESLNVPALLSTQTLAADGEITFSAIPQTYRDLELTFELRANHAGSGGMDEIGLHFNDHAGAGDYNSQRLYAYQSVAAALESLAQLHGIVGNVPDSTAPAGCIGFGRIRFPGYSAAGGYPAWYSDVHANAPGGGGRRVLCNGICWGLARPITSIKLFGTIGGGLFAAGGRAALYGVP